MVHKKPEAELYLKKILYISYDGMTDPLGQSQVLSYLSGLAGKGFDFTILSAEKKDKFYTGSSEIKKLCKQNNIRWIPVLYHKYPPVFSTLFDLLKIYLKAMTLCRKEKFDIIHCRSYLPAMIGMALKRKFRCGFLFDMRGFWVDERVDGKIWNLKNPVYRIIYSFFKKKEKELMIHADHIISLTNNAKKEIDSWKLKGEERLPISVIPCCVDLNLFSPDQVDKAISVLFKERAGIKNDEYVLSYLGTLGTWYMLDEMLDFFKTLLVEKPNSHFLFITLEEKNFILSAVRKKNIPSEKITVVHAKRKEVPVWLSLSDASIFFIKLVFSKKASFPTKQGEIMSMGIPIICNTGVGDTDGIIHSANAGILISNFHENHYRTAIKKLIHLTDFNKEMEIAYARKHFSLEQGVEMYQRVYADMITGKIYQ